MMSPRWGYCDVAPLGRYYSNRSSAPQTARRAKPRRLCSIHLGRLLVERSRDDSVQYTWGVCSSSEAETTLFNTLGAFARRAKPRRLCSIHLGRLLVERSRDDSVRYTWGVCSSCEAETIVHFIQLPTSTSLGVHSTSLGEHWTSLGEHSTSLGEHSTSLGEHSISLGVHTALI